MQFWAGGGVDTNGRCECVNAKSKLSKSSTQRRRGYRERQKVDEKKTEKKKVNENRVCRRVQKSRQIVDMFVCVLFLSDFFPPKDGGWWGMTKKTQYVRFKLTSNDSI